MNAQAYEEMILENARRTIARRERLAAEDDWTPEYEKWRHGGWYVTNICHPSGAVGCVSRNYPDRKWRIVCDPREGSWPGGPNDHTYPSRDGAAWAERQLSFGRETV